MIFRRGGSLGLTNHFCHFHPQNYAGKSHPQISRREVALNRSEAAKRVITSERRRECSNLSRSGAQLETELPGEKAKNNALADSKGDLNDEILKLRHFVEYLLLIAK
jgi:hypothetical protein